MGKSLARTIALKKHEAVVLAILAVVIAGMFLYADTRPAFSSSEVRFTELSESGLQIVPASCPSSPHYANECSGGGIRRVGQCTIWASDYALAAGESATVSWLADDGFSLDMGGWSISYTYSSGSITAIGSVPRSGSLMVAPAQTTTYVFTANYASDWAAASIFGPPPSLKCDATVTVGGDNPPPLSPPLSPPTSPPSPQCTPQYFCSGNDTYYRNAQCGESFVQACAWGCSGGGCLPPPPPEGNITATPTVVRSGNTSTISWTTQYTESCTVTEDNAEINDSWAGPNGSQASSGLTQQTVYTLRCTGVDGSELLDTAKVNIIPVWEEQ